MMATKLMCKSCDKFLGIYWRDENIDWGSIRCGECYAKEVSMN